MESKAVDARVGVWCAQHSQTTTVAHTRKRMVVQFSIARSWRRGRPRNRCRLSEAPLRERWSTSIRFGSGGTHPAISVVCRPACCRPRGFAVEAHRVGHHLRQLGDGHVRSCADVHPSWFVVHVHQVQAGRREVVHVEEFAHGLACAPAGDGRQPGLLGFVETPNHCRQHVAVFRVVVVARAIQVGGMALM